MESTGFKNPIASKPEKKVRDPWNYEMPAYDERTSCFIRAGDDLGVGHRTPVGKDKASPYAVPMGRHKTMRTDEAYHKGHTQDISK